MCFRITTATLHNNPICTFMEGSSLKQINIISDLTVFIHLNVQFSLYKKVNIHRSSNVKLNNLNTYFNTCDKKV